MRDLSDDGGVENKYRNYIPAVKATVSRSSWQSNPEDITLSFRALFEKSRESCVLFSS
jgi:hypothetical protein